VGIATTVPSHLDSYNWASMHLVTKEQLFAHGPEWTNVPYFSIDNARVIYTKKV